MMFGKKYNPAPIHREVWRLASFQRSVEWKGHGWGTARAPGRAGIAQNCVSVWVRAGQWRHINQSLVHLNVKLKLLKTQMGIKCAQWHSTEVTVTHFSKKAQSDPFPGKFLLKKEYSGYAIISAEAAKWLQIFKISAGAPFNSFPLRVGQGSGEASCEHRAPQDAGDTCTMPAPAGRESTECWEGAAADQNCNCSGEEQSP